MLVGGGGGRENLIIVLFFLNIIIQPILTNQNEPKKIEFEYHVCWWAMSLPQM